MKTLVTILIIISFVGCNPDRFVLNQKSDNILFGKILDNLDSFEQINDNSFVLNNGRVAIRSLLFTQSSFSYNYKLSKGDSVKFILRTVEHLYDNKNGITILIDKTGTKIFENDVLISQNTEINTKVNSQRYVNFRTVGDLIIFRHDCEEIKIKTKMPATEFILIKSPENGEIYISGMEVEKIIDNTSIKNFEN
jgi:hypothetical protein